MKRIAKSLFYNFVGRNRNTIVIKSIVKICKIVVNAYFSNDFYDMKYNGEEMLIRNMSKIYSDREFVVFDAGSNVGEYIVLTQRYFPNSIVHSFELFYDNYCLLKNNDLISSKNVTFNCVGLSDSAKEVDANYFPSNPRTGGINSLEWDKRNNVEKEIIKVKVIRGDDYAKKHEIGTINLLKIDTEGHDFFVLSGFDALLSAGLIDVVQFEHGRAAIPSRIMLADFYEYLVSRGYVVGRLHPGGVELKPYDPFEDEYNSTGIYVAIHNGKKDVVTGLGIPNKAKR